MATNADFEVKQLQPLPPHHHMLLCSDSPFAFSKPLHSSPPQLVWPLVSAPTRARVAPLLTITIFFTLAARLCTSGINLMLLTPPITHHRQFFPILSYDLSTKARLIRVINVMFSFKPMIGAWTSPYPNLLLLINPVHQDGRMSAKRRQQVIEDFEITPSQAPTASQVINLISDSDFFPDNDDFVDGDLEYVPTLERGKGEKPKVNRRVKAKGRPRRLRFLSALARGTRRATSQWC